MIWLAIEMWALLLVAFLLGASAAVWTMSARRSKSATSGDAADNLAGVKAAAPTLLFDAPDGQKDDLTQIIGIDPDTENRLNTLGVYHLRQIATWDDSAARWIEIRLNEPGRVTRERWTEQATAIA